MKASETLASTAVLFREAYRSSRQWQTYASRTFFSGALLGVLLAAIAIVLAEPEFLDPAEMAKYGRLVFAVFSIIQVILAIGLAPLMVASAVIQERESKQFELIGLTNIAPSALFSGIVFARLLQLYTVILGSLPILALVVQLGGVSVIEVVVVVVHTLTACTVLGALGGLFGLFTRSASLAVLPTACIAMLLFVMVPTGYLIASANPWSAAHLSPFMASQAKDWWALLPVIAYIPVVQLTIQIGSGIFSNLLRGLDIRAAYRGQIWHPKRAFIALGVLLICFPFLLAAILYLYAHKVTAGDGGTPFSHPIADHAIYIGSSVFIFLNAMGIIYLMTWVALRFLVDITDGFDRILFGIRRRRHNPKRLRVWMNPIMWRESRPSTIFRLGLPLWSALLIVFVVTSQVAFFIPGSFWFLALYSRLSRAGFQCGGRARPFGVTNATACSKYC